MSMSTPGCYMLWAGWTPKGKNKSSERMRHSKWVFSKLQCPRIVRFRCKVVSFICSSNLPCQLNHVQDNSNRWGMFVWIHIRKIIYLCPWQSLGTKSQKQYLQSRSPKVVESWWLFRENITQYGESIHVFMGVCIFIYIYILIDTCATEVAMICHFSTGVQGRRNESSLLGHIKLYAGIHYQIYGTHDVGYRAFCTWINQNL